MNIATQNRAFFPTAIMEKFEYIKAMGFDGYEIDGGCWWKTSTK